MNLEFKDLDFIDLVSERHLQLRTLAETLWNETSDIYISNSEWFILTLIYKYNTTTLARLSKKVDISRQATHKLVKRLEEKELIEISNAKNNKKEKSIKLTSVGRQCCEKNEQLKMTITDKIVKEIGNDNFLKLKEILMLEWGLEKEEQAKAK